MKKGVFGKIAAILIFSLGILLLPLACLGYVEGDINSDNKIGLEESIYSLQVAAGFGVPVSGTTINVPDDIPTIQQAIDAASDGDIINIAAGTFNEALTINGKILTLTGDGSGSTIIDGTIASVAENVVTIEHSPGVGINNLTVQNGAKGIFALLNSYVEISQVVVEDCTDRGIQIDNNSNAEISDTTIDNTGRDGISIYGNSNVYITGTVTTQNNARRGLHLFMGSGAFIDQATFTSSGNNDSGVNIAYNSTLFLYDSNFSSLNDAINGIQTSSSSAIGIYGASSVTVDNAGDIGIGIYGSSRLYSQGGITITGATNDGIEAAGASDVSLKSDVSISNCGGTGFAIIRSSSAYITAQLEILNSGLTGILLIYGSSLSTADTADIIVQNTTGDGVGIGIWENSILRANGGSFDIQNNIEGISMARNSTLSLRNRGSGLNAVISNNALVGIGVWEPGHIRAEAGLSVINNTGVGIALKRGATARIQDSIIQGNGGWGIEVSSGANMDVSNSTIQTNNGTGNDIYLGFGSQSTLNGNTIGTPMICDSTALSQGDFVCP